MAARCNKHPLRCQGAKVQHDMCLDGRQAVYLNVCLRKHCQPRVSETFGSLRGYQVKNEARSCIRVLRPCPCKELTE